MLYLILIWTGLGTACLILGCRLLQHLAANSVHRLGDRLILSAWLGLGLFSIQLLATALIVPLTPPVGLGSIVLSMSVALLHKATRLELQGWIQRLNTHKLRKNVVACYTACCIVIAFFSTQPVSWIDTGLYHYGLVRWLAQYGVTPGLALINSQFGFVSAWFALLAPFNSVEGAGRASTAMNGFVLLLALLQLCIALFQIWSQRYRRVTPNDTKARSTFSRSAALSCSSALPCSSELDHSSALARKNNRDSIPIDKAGFSAWFLFIFSLVSLLLLTQTSLLASVSVSASPDPAIALFVGVTAWSLLVTDTFEQPLVGPSLIPLTLAIVTLSLKLTALPLLAVTFIYYWIKQPGFIRLGFGSCYTFVLLLPFLLSQTLTSSCPLYPSTLGCIRLPWHLKASQVNQLAAQTHGGSNWFGQPPAGVNRHLWLAQKWIESNQSSQLMALLIVLSIAIGLYCLLRQKPSLQSAVFWLVILAWLGSLFSLLKAPLFRFGMGFMLLLPVLAAALLCTQLWQVYWTRYRRDRTRKRTSQAKAWQLVASFLGACQKVKAVQTTYIPLTLSLVAVYFITQGYFNTVLIAPPATPSH